MQILGKIELQGKQKEILLKEEDGFLKYYSLEWLQSYIRKEGKNEIIFNNEIELTKENKLEIINLSKLNKEILQKESWVEIIGMLEIQGKQEEILLKKDGKVLEYYYLNLIGVYSPKIPGETIIFRQDTLENAVSNEIKDSIQKNTISPLEQEKVKQFIESMKMEKFLGDNEINDRKTKQKTNYDKSRIIKNEIKKDTQPNMQNVLKKEQQKYKNKLGDINIKQEVKMDTRVSDMKNLQQVLERNTKIPNLEKGDAPLKMGIVEANELKKLRNEKGENEKGQTDRYEAVVITNKGEIKPLHLENDKQEGTNPTEKNYQIKQNEEVEKGDVDTRLKVGKGTIGIEKGQYGEVEVYHSPRKTIGGKGIEGNKSLDRQLETSESKNTLEGTDIDDLKLDQEYQDGYRSVEAGYQEVRKNKEQNFNKEPKEAKDIDGNLNTHSQTHDIEEYVELSSGEKVSYNKLASRWGFYKDGKPDAEYAKEKLNEKKEKEDKKPEEIIDELDEEFEDPRTPEHRR